MNGRLAVFGLALLAIVAGAHCDSGDVESECLESCADENAAAVACVNDYGEPLDGCVLSNEWPPECRCEANSECAQAEHCYVCIVACLPWRR